MGGSLNPHSVSDTTFPRYLVTITPEERHPAGYPAPPTGGAPHGDSDDRTLGRHRTRGPTNPRCRFRLGLDLERLKETFITNRIGADLVVVTFSTDPTQSVIERHHPVRSQIWHAGTRGRSHTQHGWSARSKHCPSGRRRFDLTHVRTNLDATLASARDRRAFGEPIGAFHPTSSEWLTPSPRWTLRRPTSTRARSLARQARSARRARRARQRRSTSRRQVQRGVLDTCVQSQGGYGYMRENRVGRTWMDARVTRIGSARTRS